MQWLMSQFYYRKYYHSVLFIPKYKQEEVVNGLLKALQRAAENDAKGKTSPAKGTLLQLVEAVSRKYSVPLVLFD